MAILVTGGAGYIGSHVVRLLRQNSEEVVVVDDLQTGKKERIPGVPLLELSLESPDSVEALVQFMDRHSVKSVLHFAGRKQVLESVEKPAWYFQQNIGGLSNLLLAMETVGVSELVFSSSAAVYGSSEGPSITERAHTVPINPYGYSKLAGEHLIEFAYRQMGIRAASLRYFNVAGAGWPELADTAVLNLVPMVFERLDANKSPLIFGADYSTPDGTCIRDFIHVLDLAEAHVETLNYLRTGPTRHEVFNVGTGTGTSVKSMIDLILQTSGSSSRPKVEHRRDGDPAEVVCNPELIKKTIGWASKRSPTEIIRSAWDAHLHFQKTL